MNRQQRGERVRFLGLRFDNLAEEEVIAEVLEKAEASDFAYVVTPNVDHVVELHRDPAHEELWLSYEAADICVCDSRILHVMAKSSGIALQVVPGSDLTVHLLGRIAARAKAISVVGGSEEILASLESRFPSCTWRHHLPPMGVRTNSQAQQAIIDFVETSDADIVFFAIGAPQSELLCHRLKSRQKARGVALCIGASLEFVTGAKRRAPRWIQRLALEWLFRLVSEPSRLWRRYLAEGPAIFRIWARYQLRACHHRGGSGSNSPDGR
ncbi:WecB/TagA/CpsF family glycosyltransferase [Altererythrobacter sp. SALINAS58]|uniref:WecB/TagA/CpsF family glycosyltransferase n=1 Tax=Alteripontixanthobacter muriae TaxID=2705546 RepID=UPI0015759CAC|nr:WecB/TagA/CpsF family glycosyltransferase [Alteripontixanthobacter muriae]